MGNKTELKKSLSLQLLIWYGVGTILGVGIYVLIGKVAGEAGMLTPLAFVVSAFLASFTGLSYAELSSRKPSSAGEVNFVQEAFGIKPFSGFIGWLIVLSAIVSTSTMVIGYVGYVQVFADISDWIIISALIILLTGVAIWGIKESAILITAITFIELGGLLLVIVIAGDNLMDFGSRWQEFIPSANFIDLRKVLIGAFIAFYAFIGFEDMVNVADEVKNPKKNIPRAIIISLIIVTILYILISVIAVLGLSTEELDKSTAPLVDILSKEGEQYGKIIGLIALVAIINGVLVQIVMASRIIYGMSLEKMAPSFFSKVNKKTQTPILATVAIGLPILILGLLLDLKGLAKMTNYIIIFVFVIVNLSLWKIKKQDPHPEGVRTFPVFIPIIGGILSLAFLLFQLLSDLGYL